MDGALSSLTSDAALRAHGTTAGDRFEYMGQANPSDGMLRWQVPPFRFVDRVRELDAAAAGGVSFEAEAPIESTLAPRNVDLTAWPITLDLNHPSYHQKFLVIDDGLAFIGGMNLRRVDWDTSQHRVFEPRRMLLDSSTSNRMAVAARDRLPDTGPRKDYMVRIEGPLARDAQDVFHRRWRYLLDQRARYSDDASDFAVAAPTAPVPGGVQAQVTATLPAPFHEYAIAETWANAIAQAREYIYIEDQYFRIPMLTDAIAQRMTEVPTLRLVVITKPINEFTDPGCPWTYLTHGVFSTRFPNRYRLLQLRAFDTQVTFGIDETDARFVDMDTHAKILIVDDVFLSVGSCNKNNRGVLYEGELNVAVHDRAWVAAARRRIFANILQRTDVPDAVDGWWAAFEAQRAWNDAVRQRWTDEGDDLNLHGAPLPEIYRPRGFVYTLTFGPVRDCLIEDVGPDVV
jgi:phosphatidylserine/phosphatidylglycerophosphate/cardiolipin synthase-like enzyme